MNRIWVKAAWSLVVLFPLIMAWSVPLFRAMSGSKTWNFSDLRHQTIIAAVPFVILALFLHLKKRNNQKRIDLAAMFAFLSVFIPSTILWSWLHLDALLQWSVGANIGLGFLLMLSPVYLPVLMLLGFAIGSIIESQISHE